MKTLIVIALAGALTACNCGSMSNQSIANEVRRCTNAQLDYNLVYNDKGKVKDVICYKPGHPPPGSKYPEIIHVPATDEPLEYVQ